MLFHGYSRIFSYCMAVLLASALPFSNITYLWDVQDGGTRFVYAIVAAVSSIFFLKKIYGGAIVKAGKTIPLLFLLLMMTTVLAINDARLWPGVFELALRLFCLWGLFSMCTSYPSIPLIFARHYLLIFLLSLLIGILTWFLFPKPEFVFYDGSARRFAGLHFELFAFMYSAAICYATSKMFYRVSLMAVTGFLLLTVQAQSNAAIPFLLIAFAPERLLAFIARPPILVTCTVAMVFSPVLAGMVIDQLSILSALEVRSSSSFTAEGSALYVRLYPHALAAATMMDQGLLASLLPNGYGWFAASDMIRNDERSMGGFGASKMIIDAGVALALLICFSLAASFKKCCADAPDMTGLTVKLYFLSLFFVSFGSGFFNLVAWFILLCWPKSLEKIRYEKTPILHR